MDGREGEARNERCCSNSARATDRQADRQAWREHFAATTTKNLGIRSDSAGDSIADVAAERVTLGRSRQDTQDKEVTVVGFSEGHLSRINQGTYEVVFNVQVAMLIFSAPAIIP